MINNKHLTQGGQVVFYMMRMFMQVNAIIFKWTLCFFIFLSALIFFLFNSSKFLAIKMAFYYYSSKLINLFFPKIKMSVSLGEYHFKATVYDIVNHVEFIKAGDYFLKEIYFSFTVSFIISLVSFFLFCIFLSKKGENQSKNDYVKC